MVGAKGHDWTDKLINTLWAYRTSIRTPTGQTPFALTYGMETVVPFEVMVPSSRIQLNNEINAKDKRQLLSLQLDLLDEKRLQAAEHARLYQERLARAYKKKVIERKFNIGEWVLKEILPRKHGKLRPNWEGPYLVVEAYPGNAYCLAREDGTRLEYPWNALHLMRYYF